MNRNDVEAEAGRWSFPPGRPWVATAVCALAWIASTRADDVIPKAFPADRYAKMAAHSPFTPPTPPTPSAAAPTPPPAPGFAEKLAATMLADDGNGVYIAIVADQENSKKYLVTSDKVDEESSLQIATVKWPQTRDDQPGARETPVIVLRKGAQQGVVRYDPSLGGIGPIGGAPAGGGTGIPRPFIPGNAGVRPPGAPIIPGNVTGGVGIAPPPAPATAGAPNAIRRAPIRVQPQPATVPAVRSVVPANPALRGARPTATKVDDDDDDDD